METRKEIKLKTGETMPKGLPVRFDEDRPTRCRVTYKDAEVTVRVTSAFNAPSHAKLEAMLDDGICKSIAGRTVEPDGWDDKQTPSWLLAMGFI